MRNAERIKKYGLSWVIVLKFKSVNDAENFAQSENLDIRHKGETTVVVTMEKQE